MFAVGILFTEALGTLLSETKGLNHSERPFLFWWGERFIRSVTDQELRALHHQTFFDRDANRDLCRSACQLQISHKSATGILVYGNVWR